MTAILTRTMFGIAIVPPYDEYLSKALIRNGVYCPDELETWMPYIPVGGTVVDAGANVGAHTLAFAAQVGREGTVFAVEPQRMLCSMLHGSLALNGINHVHVKNCALGREKGIARIPKSLDYGQHANFGGLSLKDIPPEVPCEPIPVLTIDGWKLSRLDFFKIDVEGAELAVLHGSVDTVASQRPVISVEADREENVPAIMGWLKQRDYRAWWHKPKLGALWMNERGQPIVSINLLALPRERSELPEPTGDVEVAIE